eukprot:8224460-Pyramimonas_sp.AAC.1
MLASMLNLAVRDSKESGDVVTFLNLGESQQVIQELEAADVDHGAVLSLHAAIGSEALEEGVKVDRGALVALFSLNLCNLSN